MKIQIKATKIKLSQKTKDYIQMKMDMLEKYLGDIKVINCDVEIEKTMPHQKTGDIYRAEVNLQVPKEILRIEKTEKDLSKAIDKVKDHMARSIKKYKEKMQDAKRKSEK